MGLPLGSPVAKLSCEAATEENAKRRSFMPWTQVTGKANFSPGITSGLRDPSAILGKCQGNLQFPEADFRGTWIQSQEGRQASASSGCSSGASSCVGSILSHSKAPNPSTNTIKISGRS